MQKFGEREQGTSLFRKTTVEFALILAVTHCLHLLAYRNVHLIVVPLKDNTLLLSFPLQDSFEEKNWPNSLRSNSVIFGILTEFLKFPK